MLSKNWWLLVLAGVLNAVIAVIYFDHAQNGFLLRSTILLMSKLAFGAGVCVIVAGVWNFRNAKSWLLVLNGLALAGLGFITSGAALGEKISFRTVALVIIAMAVSLAVFEFATARELRRNIADEWLFGAAGAISIGFAFLFVALGFRWVRLEQPGSVNLWLGAFFAFTALCMALPLKGMFGQNAMENGRNFENGSVAHP